MLSLAKIILVMTEFACPDISEKCFEMISDNTDFYAGILILMNYFHDIFAKRIFVNENSRDFKIYDNVILSDKM